jgi:D-arginine dehydrogenase
MSPPAADVIVVGAGVAGASVAFHLARRGERVLVLEREPLPGIHASGRNAAMFYALVRPLEIATLAAASRRFLEEPPGEVSAEPLLGRRGSLTLVGDRRAVDEKLALSAALGVRAGAVTPGEIRRIVPFLRDEEAEGIFCADDGILDISGIVQGLLRGARAHGARVECGAEARGLETAHGRVVGVKTATGTLPCGTVVDAAGAWAGLLGRARGSTSPPLVAYRRHLVFVRAPSEPGPSVVDDREPFYVRPETGGYLASPCDQDPHPPDIPPVDAVRVAEGMAGIARLTPALAAAPLGRAWACLRTRTPDESFVIGPDPALRGYFWMAGLGGHGMTAGVAAGALAASLHAGETVDAAWASPSRFST